MPDYQLSKVYQIVCLTTGQKYIGSTTQKNLALRLAGHRKDYNRWKRDNGNFVSSYPIIERDNYQIELIEAYPCNSKDELNAREGHYIRTVECINKNIAGRTRQEWFILNKTEVELYKKVYYENNKTEIAEKAKKYREANKIEIADKQKASYQEHKIERAEYQKSYLQKKKSQANI
jgi:small-conductance mechanosensitive channel